MSVTTCSPLIEALLRPEAYPHPVERVEMLETYAAWVLLTGRYAYKVKKPFDLGHADFSTLALRRRACQEEVRLNRRLAPDLYVDVVAIRGTENDPVIGDTDVVGAEDVLEVAVKMREFPQRAQLDRRLAAGAVGEAEMQALAARLAAFHGDLRPAGGVDRWGTPERVLASLHENVSQVLAGSDDPRELQTLARLRAWSASRGAELTPLLTQRRDAGFVRECHGDLRLRNLVALESGITAFDCIEFDAALRWTDVASEVALLMLDLRVRGRDDLAHLFASSYAERTGDYDGVRMLPFYLVARAMARARVAVSLLDRQGGADPETRVRLGRHIALAERIAGEGRPALVLASGPAGSGKTWLTERLIGPLRGIRVRSDLERKRLFGLGPDARIDTELQTGMFTPEASHRTYVRVEETAEAVIAAGLPVLIDAASLRVAQRARFRRLAEELGVPFALLRCGTHPERLRSRVARRVARGDASEATIGVLEHQLATQEAPTADELEHAVVVDTGYDVAPAVVARRLADVLGSGAQVV